MIKTLAAILIFAGTCSAYPREDERTFEARTESKPEGPIAPPLEAPIRPPPVELVALESGPFTDQNKSVPAEASENIPAPQAGPKPEGSESDLKTDATFWWPSYRSYWRYPTYRTYWRYPSYRYYRPRAYYRYYYW